jgi:hypothetical protein
MNARSLFLTGSLAALLMLTAVGRVCAADLNGPFDAANKLYAEGKYAAAADGYEQAIRQAQAAGVASPVLYFNAGNAEFKPGRAPYAARQRSAGESGVRSQPSAGRHGASESLAKLGGLALVQ